MITDKAEVVETLKIGDYVTLRQLKLDGLLGAEGILEEDLGICFSEYEILDDALFAIHLKRQYSASREYDDFVGAGNSKSGADKYISALKRGKLNEKKLNDHYMRTRLKEPVKFGDTIQLFHVKSGKYLRVFPDKLAKDERQNLLVQLSASGDIYSWINVLPRFKIDHIGDPVHSGTEIYLAIAERANEFIHCSERDPLPGRLREINCSLEATSWKITIFQTIGDAVEAQNSKLALAYQMVYINDPEQLCNLALPKTPLESLEDAMKVTIGGGDEEEQRSRPPSAAGMGQDEAENSHFHEFGDVILEPMSSSGITSRMLWFIENEVIGKGGTVKWKISQVRFRHVNSGLYLKLVTNTTINEDGDEVDSYLLTTTLNPLDEGTLFNTNEINSPRKLLSLDKPVHICAGRIYFERGAVLDGFSFEVKCTNDKSAAINFKIFKFLDSSATMTTDLQESESSYVEPNEIFSGLSLRACLTKYYNMTVVPRSSFVTTVWPTADRNDVQFFNSVLEKAVFFSQGFPISATNIKLDVDKASDKLRIIRQHLLCDQGVLDVLLRLISKLTFVSNRGDDSPKLMKSAAAVSEEETILLAMGRNILEKCFSLLLWCVRENPENQMYVADHMPVLLAHLSGQPLAGKCVTEMLASNMELQETKIGTREIAIFVEKLRSSKMNSMYLQLLKACCSCQGNGVDGNQCKVTDMLYSNTADVIIQLHADFARVTPVSWNYGLYVTESPVPGCPLEAESLVTKGIPKLSLAWTTNSIDFSPLGLFGKLSVGVDELYAPIVMMEPKAGAKVNKSQDKKKAASMAQKAAVANYFVSQMMLGAEMCMDRNYIAFHTLDEYFPYPILVSILRMDVTEDIQCAAFRLILCLHVDRDPQAETSIPQFTRTWTELLKGQGCEPRLPYVEPGRRHHYGLIQQIISEHLVSMAGRPWTELSRHVLQLLRKLIQFNFYGTNERMRDVIGPLILALDRRNVKEPVIMKSSKFSTKSNSNLLKEGGEDSANTYGNEGEIVEVNGEGDGENESNGEPFAQKLLDIMEGLWMTLFIAILVIGAIASLVYETISGDTSDPGSILFIFTVCVDIIFALEIAIRAYCVKAVRGSLLKHFFSKVLNWIDILVIAIDVVFFVLHTGGSDSGKYVKALRLIRLVRLLRLFRAAKIISVASVLKKKKSKTSLWQIPTRYSKCPQHELQTMIESVQILQISQKIIEDRNLTLLLNYFYAWETGSDTRSPSELFLQAIEDSQRLSLGINDFDHVMVDVLMFINSELVQCTLEILMAYHSTKRALLRNIAQVQLLVCSKRERQFKTIDQMLQQLEQNAETHELWGELATEADQSTNKQTKDIMKELADICRVKCESLEFDTDHRSDRQIQDLYRNLGCFNICLKVLGLSDGIEEDENGELDEVSLNTQNLCLLCNNLLYWFFMGNAENQELGYGEVEYFVETLDSNINSHLVLRSIFRGNEKLMRTIPHTYLNMMMEKICKADPAARSPYDLELMLSIAAVNPTHGIKENQIEIMKQLTAPGRVKDVVSYFVPISDPTYQHKQALMAPFLSDFNVAVSSLPVELQYHLVLLDVFSNLTIGKTDGITAIEAKLQSLYDYAHIADAIMDPKTILVVRTKLSNFFFNGIIDVELKIPGLEYTAIIWKLMQAIDQWLLPAPEEFTLMKKLGLGHKQLSRRKLENHLINISIVGGFFSIYFDVAEFSLEDLAASAETVTLSSQEVYAIIESLLRKIDIIYKTIESSGFITVAHKTMIQDCMSALVKSLPEPPNLSDVKVDVVDDAIPPVAEDDDEPGRRLEAAVCEKYQEFVNYLINDEEIQQAANTENTEFITVLEGLPFILDEVDSDIRQETLFKKLVMNIRENLQYVNNERRLSPRMTKTAIWIIQAFRTMIENRMGMSIYERDEDGGLEQDIAAAPVISALNACGATTLCLDLISVGIDPELQLEAVRLGVGLLFKEGGALEVQKIFNHHLMTTESHYFFRQVHATIQNLIAWHKARDIALVPEGEEVKLPDSILLIRFVQLMSEGHFLPNQDIVRAQPNNVISINLLDDFAEYLEALSRLHCRTSTTAGIAVASTILEVIQGPCKMNQQHFVMKTELVETMNRLLRATVVLDCVSEDEVEMKKTVIDIFQGILEGQPITSVVYERVLNVIHMDIIMQLSGNEKLEEGAPKRILTDEEEILQTECIVLLQILCDCKPSLRGELGLPTSVEEVDDKETACVEIVWNNELNRRFFHIPDICRYLSKSSMDYVVEYVDRTTLENKLTDFLEHSHNLYREIKHHQLLLEYRLTAVFSKKNFDRSTWFSFFLAIAINGIFLGYYEALDGHEPALPQHITPVVNALNSIQIITNVYNLLIVIVVLSPVKYQSLCSLGYSGWNAILWTALEPMTVYYFGYMLFSVFGVVFEDYFLSFLLLDIIVKNTSTRNVLMAVYQPRQQLMYVSILVIFTVYIYSFFLFTFFREQVNVDNSEFPLNGFSLWNTFKLSLTYGLRQAGGVGDMFTSTLGNRWVLDVMFFLSILVVVLNLVYGIIIMTFSVLRQEKGDREDNTQNYCFVCGIDRAEFDRASEKGDGFKLHIKFDHNMWNYVRFMIFLWEQDRDDDDGLEQYVRRAIVANDLNWFPMNKAIRLEAARSNDVDIVKALDKRVRDVDKNLTQRLAVVQSEVNVVLEQVSQALKQEHMGANEADELMFIPSTVRQISGAGDDASESAMIEFDAHKAVGTRPDKPVYIEILEIKGLETTDPETVFVSMSTEGKLHTLSGHSSVNNCITFPPTRYLVAKHANIEDTQICRIRVYQRLHVVDLESGAFEDVDELIGFADFTYSELVFADGLCLDKFFVNVKEPKYYNLTVFTTSIGQISFE